MWRRINSACLLILAGSSVVVAQRTKDDNRIPETQPIVSQDVGTIDGILSALYDTLGGPAGEIRDWKRIRTLYHPKAAWHMPVVPSPDGHGVQIVIGSFDDYKGWTQPWFDKNSFYEREITRRVERFGHIAHAFVTFEALRSPDDERPFKRGVNSIQLYWDEDRWWILSVLWEDETPDYPLPGKYLKQ